MTPASPETSHQSPWQVFWIFLRLGLTSFGGPVAHLGYFRAEFVLHRQWLTERSYADLVAMCQFLPGPASSQVGMALGLLRAGLPGALAAWLGFTLPSALLLAGLGLGLASGTAVLSAGALHGLKVVAVAVVAQAVWGMARTLCVGLARVTLMVLAACAMLLWPGVWAQVGVMLLANMRMCANVPAQHAIQTALGGYQSITELVVPGGRFYEQSKLASRLLNEIPGVSCVEPMGALYCFPRLDPEVYPIESDEAFVIDLLRAKKILVTHGTGFNWFEPDHFRLVTLPDVDMLTEAIGRIADYLETIRN